MSEREKEFDSMRSNFNSLECWDYTVELQCIQESQGKFE